MLTEKEDVALAVPLSCLQTFVVITSLTDDLAVVGFSFYSQRYFASHSCVSQKPLQNQHVSSLFVTLAGCTAYYLQLHRCPQFAQPCLHCKLWHNFILPSPPPPSRLLLLHVTYVICSLFVLNSFNYTSKMSPTLYRRAGERSHGVH